MSATVEVAFPAGKRLRVLRHRAERHDFATWERDYLEALADVLRPGHVVFDVGAEQGEVSVFAGSIVGPRRMHLFEPGATSWPVLRATFEANGLAPARCFPGFVSDADRGWAGDPERADWPRESLGRIDPEVRFAVVTERPDIAAVTLNTWAARYGAPDVVMMDVEGAEACVVAGAAAVVLRRHRPIVFVSVHPSEWIARIGGSRETLFGTMAAHGYTARHISTDHEEHWVFTPEG